MSRQKSIEELKVHQESAMEKVNRYIGDMISSGNEKDQGKADKLCYWLEDWTNFLNFETSFSPMSLRRYKRGEIIKVHLGFNVGSEEGGLHYAVVLDKQNAKSSPVVTVVPLTSVKQNTDIAKLHSGTIFLGDDLYNKLNLKVKTTKQNAESEIASLQETIDQLNAASEKTPSEVIESLRNKAEKLQEDAELLDRMQREIQKLKKGSLALVNQITTISKIRIYDPKTDHDILSGIKLSNDKLDMIDAELVKKFTRG